MKTESRILAWQFLPAVGKLAHPKSCPAKVRVELPGKTKLYPHVSVLGALSMCCGTVLCRVECWGDMDLQHQKCLAMTNITPQLKLFAVRCGERALPIFEKEYPKDKRPQACIEMAKRYLDGKASLDELHVAYAGARATSDALASIANFGNNDSAPNAAAAACAALAVAAAACALTVKTKAANYSAATTYACFFDAVAQAEAQAYAAARATKAEANAIFKLVRERQEKDLLSLLPAPFDEWK